MKPHPYHLCLMKYAIRQKMKGHPRFALTCHDRKELVEKQGVKISPNHIHKVLGDGPKARKSFYQNTLNELVAYLDFEDWNHFMRSNPVPERFFDEPVTDREIEDAVMDRLCGE